MLEKTKFRIDGCFSERVFEGYAFKKRQYWNGWATPKFSFKIASKIMEFINRDGGKAWYDAEKDSFNVIQLNCNDEDMESFNSNTFIVEGEELKLYAIGAYSWIWEEVKEIGNMFSCTCGNTSDSEGFYPCDKEGEKIEPTTENGWEGLFVCDRCNKIIVTDF